MKIDRLIEFLELSLNTRAVIGRYPPNVTRDIILYGLVDGDHKYLRRKLGSLCASFLIYYCI